MSVSPTLQKLIFTIVILAVIGYVGFTTIFGEADLSQVSVDVPIGDTVGQDILIMADKLDTITIDTSVFASPLFTTLIDITSPVLDEEKGRLNPFLPIGNETGIITNVKR